VAAALDDAGRIAVEPGIDPDLFADALPQHDVSEPGKNGGAVLLKVRPDDHPSNGVGCAHDGSREPFSHQWMVRHLLSVECCRMGGGGRVFCFSGDRYSVSTDRIEEIADETNH
jgi:hypothetical protein